MKKIIISGGRALKGQVKIHGAKNASLAIMCAALMSDRDITLENIPNISDIRVLKSIINIMGGKVNWGDSGLLYIVPPDRVDVEAPQDQAKKLRASNLLLGPLLAKYSCAKIAMPGGCNIGARPMDLHFKGLSKMGADIAIEKGCIVGRVNRLEGATIYLDFPSVGATENIMMAACLAKGQTFIENAAKEPEIVDLASFLNAMGAKVRGAGTDLIKITGVEELNECSKYTVIPDRIEAGTYMVAAAATRGDVLIQNVIPKHLEPLIAKMREASVGVIVEEDRVRVIADRPLKSVDIKTMPYPGFPTDMQSQMMVLLSTIPGTSVIVENIFENRFQVVDELKKLGAKIKVEGRIAVIEGVDALQGSEVKATDLRAGAALLIAGLVAKGETKISNSEYIYRGYQDIQSKFKGLGANIEQI